jgi:hypothetical protein
MNLKFHKYWKVLIKWISALFSLTSLYGASHGIPTFRELLNIGVLQLLLSCIWTDLYKEKDMENIIHIRFSSTDFPVMVKTIHNFIRHCCRQNLFSLSISSWTCSARIPNRLGLLIIKLKSYVLLSAKPRRNGSCTGQFLVTLFSFSVWHSCVESATYISKFPPFCNVTISLVVWSSEFYQSSQIRCLYCKLRITNSKTEHWMKICE